MFYYLFVYVSVICFENMQLKCLKIKHQMFFKQLIRTIWILQGREVKKVIKVQDTLHVEYANFHVVL